ncbi:MAG TPA: hypothetical protein VK969_08960 [Acidimicrobiia bacterium]|nr:hypothetical protein [Acidimicrobiia bacterium]
MNDQLHMGTLLWGVVLAIAGAGLTAVGFGWWEITAVDLRYAAPVLLVLIGTIILISSVSQNVHDRSNGGGER